MGAALKVKDEYFGSGPEAVPLAVELNLVSSRLCARDIIRQRVLAEVTTINAARRQHSRRALAPRSYLVEHDAGSAERQLNSSLFSRQRKVPLLDAEEECDKALDAFERHAFIMMFNDEQISSLDATLTITPGSEITFIYLMPLKGG